MPLAFRDVPGSARFGRSPVAGSLGIRQNFFIREFEIGNYATGFSVHLAFRDAPGLARFDPLPASSHRAEGLPVLRYFDHWLSRFHIIRPRFTDRYDVCIRLVIRISFGYSFRIRSLGQIGLINPVFLKRHIMQHRGSPFCPPITRRAGL
jgi:hypothetical protein